MKILYINTTSSGGARIAQDRLVEALTIDDDYQVDILSSMPLKKVLLSLDILQLLSKVYYWVTYVFKFIFAKSQGYTSFNLFPTFYHRSAYISEYDVIHLHWFGGEFISFGDLAKFNKPTIVTLHDEWMINGFKHYGTERKNWFTRLLLARKKAFLEKDNVWIVCPSKYICDKLIKSFPSVEHKVSLVPNLLGALENKQPSEFTAGDPVDKLILGFGAYNFMTDSRKNFNILASALSNLADDYDIELHVFGVKSIADNLICGVKIINHGLIASHDALTKFHKDITFFIQPAFQEAYGQTVSEALYLGSIPVIFNNTGCVDAAGGFLGPHVIQDHSSQALSNSLRFLHKLETSEKQCLHAKIVESYRRKNSKDIVITRHKELYTQMISNKETL